MFITNVRSDGLHKLGLAYEQAAQGDAGPCTREMIHGPPYASSASSHLPGAAQMSEEYPHLVYGHLTAYGRDGPDYQKPGYDIGALP